MKGKGLGSLPFMVVAGVWLSSIAHLFSSSLSCSLLSSLQQREKERVRRRRDERARRAEQRAPAAIERGGANGNNWMKMKLLEFVEQVWGWPSQPKREEDKPPNNSSILCLASERRPAKKESWWKNLPRSVGCLGWRSVCSLLSALCFASFLSSIPQRQSSSRRKKSKQRSQINLNCFLSFLFGWPAVLVSFVGLLPCGCCRP